MNWFLLAAVVTLVLVFRNPQGLAAAYGVALSAIFATNTLLAFTVFRALWRKPLWMVLPGAAVFLTVELAFFAANLGKLLSGGWLPLAVGAVFFVILTTWRRGRAILHRQMRRGNAAAQVHQPADRRAADARPGTAVFLSSAPGTVPAALRNNLVHNHVVHEQVILLTVVTRGVPHVAEERRLEITPQRLGFVGITASYGYQDEPDVPAAIRHARREGLEIDLEQTSYYVNHVSLVPAGDAPWRAGAPGRSFRCTGTRPRPPATSTSLPTRWSRWACTWRCEPPAGPSRPGHAPVTPVTTVPGTSLSGDRHAKVTPG